MRKAGSSGCNCSCLSEKNKKREVRGGGNTVGEEEGWLGDATGW